jgi:hypothetical protein
MIPWTERWMNASVTNQIMYAQALSGNFGHNTQIETFLTYNTQLRVHEKDLKL